MRIPVGTREEEREIHHYVEKTKVSEPVYVDVPFSAIALILAIILALVWGKIENHSPRDEQPTINIHIENQRGDN